MWELDQPGNQPARAVIERVAIVGSGRLGNAIASALVRAGVAVDGPYGRNDRLASADPDAVLLCVPDDEIEIAARALKPGPAVGHCSGATSLEPLIGHHAFSLHPLMTVPAGAPADVLDGAGAAVAGSSDHALAVAFGLADRLRLRPVAIADTDRVAYHAAACIASNFLVTLEDAAERLGATAGLSREQLVPLVRATVDNWAALGPERALTGPLVRGDEQTVAAQRQALARSAPELTALFDALADATRRLAARAAANQAVVA